MKIKEISNTSVAILLLRSIRSYYFYFNNKIEKIYYESCVSRILSYIRGRMLLSFRFSYCGMFVDVIERASPAVLYNSRFGKNIVNLYKKSQNRILSYLKTSLSGNWPKTIKKEFSLYSLRAVSIILILAVVVNLMLSIIFSQSLSAPQSVILSTFLLVSVFGLFCGVDWGTLKKGSIILKALFR